MVSGELRDTRFPQLAGEPRCSVDGASVERVDFSGMRFARFTAHAFFGNARFERCVFDGARLRDLVFTQEAEFVDCVFRGRIARVNFWGRPSENQAALGRVGNEFTGNDFTGAALEWVSFNHIDLRDQHLPGAPSYALLSDVSRRVDAALAAVATWPDEHHREEAAFSLGLLAEQAATYNDDMRLVRRDGPEVGRKLPLDLRHEIFDLLTAG